MKITTIGHINIALSGASGMQYGLRLIEVLLQLGIDVSLYTTKAANVVLHYENDLKISDEQHLNHLINYDKSKGPKLKIYNNLDWRAPLSSGSSFKSPLVVCPCSMGMLAAIANGNSDNIIERGCDVAIKEGLPLILVPRETPFSAIHLENMLKLTRLGVCILPANPGFYHKPKTIADIIDFIVARILDRLGIEHNLIEPWGKE